MSKNNFLSNNIAKGGIFTALSVIVLFLSNLIPINTLFFLIVASAIIPLTLISTNLKTTIIVYIATSVLSFFLLPSKQLAINYFFLFGIYGIVKFFIEKINKSWVEIILKLIFFNVSYFVIFKLTTEFFIGKSFKSPYLLLLFSNIFLFIFDYILTVFINYSHDNLLKHLK